MDDFMNGVFAVTGSIKNIVIAESAWNAMKSILTDDQLNELNNKFGDPQALPITLFVEE